MIKTAMIVVLLSSGINQETTVEKTLFESERLCESAKMELLSGRRTDDIDIICVPHIEPRRPVEKMKIIVNQSSKVKLVKDQKGIDAIKHLDQIHEAYGKIPYDDKGDVTRAQIINWFVNEFRPIMNIQRGE